MGVVTSPHVVSVNVGTPVDAQWAGTLRRTAIRKRSVTGAVRVHSLGLEGDQVADTEHHGGTYQAVYAFAQEDIDFWSEQLGERVPAGMFGENLTTSGIDVNEAVLGERWRIGSALLQPIDVRIPCNVFKNWLGVNHFDNSAWVRRFTVQARPGPYLRVLEEGTLEAGDPIVVEHRPDHGVTVSTMFRAMTTDRSLLLRLLDVGGLSEGVYEHVRSYVTRGA
jgi:MOSC domain-containing protein YiiM